MARRPGATAPSSEATVEAEGFRVGETVILVGFKDESLDGTEGIIQAAEYSTSASKVLFQVVLPETGSVVTLGKDRLVRVGECWPDDEGSSQVPPSEEQDRRTSQTSMSQESDGSSKSMPPVLQNLRHKASSSSGSRNPRKLKPSHLRPGDIVVLNGLSKEALNGQWATVLPMRGHTGKRVAVKLESTGHEVSVKCHNLEMAATGDGGSEGQPSAGDPEVRGTPPKPSRSVHARVHRRHPHPEQHDEDDELELEEDNGFEQTEGLREEMQDKSKAESPRPSEAQKRASSATVAAKAEATREEFHIGDKVVLTGLTMVELNGLQGVVVPLALVSEDKVPVRLDETGKTVAVRPHNLGLAGPPTPSPAASTSRSCELAGPPTPSPAASTSRSCEVRCKRFGKIDEASDSLGEDVGSDESFGSLPALASGELNASAGAAATSQAERTPRAKEPGSPGRSSDFGSPVRKANRGEDDDIANESRLEAGEVFGSVGEGLEVARPSLEAQEPVGRRSEGGPRGSALAREGAPTTEELSTVAPALPQGPELEEKEASSLAKSPEPQPELREDSRQPFGDAQNEKKGDEKSAGAKKLGIAKEGACLAHEDGGQESAPEIGAVPDCDSSACDSPGAMPDDEASDGVEVAPRSTPTPEDCHPAPSRKEQAAAQDPEGALEQTPEPLPEAAAERLHLAPEDLAEASKAWWSAQKQARWHEDTAPKLKNVRRKPLEQPDHFLIESGELRPNDYVVLVNVRTVDVSLNGQCGRVKWLEPGLSRQGSGCRLDRVALQMLPTGSMASVKLANVRRLSAQELSQASPSRGILLGDTVVCLGSSRPKYTGVQGKVVPHEELSHGRLALQLKSGRKISVRKNQVEKVATNGGPDDTLFLTHLQDAKQTFYKSSHPSMPSRPAKQEQRGQPAPEAADSEKAAASKSSKRLVPRTLKALQKRIQMASESTDITLITDVMTEAEQLRGTAWADELLLGERPALRQLGAKKRRWQRELAASSVVASSASGSELGEQDGGDAETVERGPSGSSLARSSLKASAANGSADEAASDFSEGQLARWCEDLQLPADLVSRLEAEDVADPRELAAVSDGDLAAFVSGIKIGPKGRFLTAVRKMRQELLEEDLTLAPAG